MAPTFKKVISFEGIGLCFYTLDGFRAPCKNEFFLSGAVVMGYRAGTDKMSQKYWNAKPTTYAIPKEDHEPGDPVRLTPGGIPLPRQYT